MRDDYYPYEDRFPREDYYPLGYRDDEEMCVYDQCCDNCARHGCNCPFEAYVGCENAPRAKKEAMKEHYDGETLKDVYGDGYRPEGNKARYIETRVYLQQVRDEKHRVDLIKSRIQYRKEAGLDTSEAEQELAVVQDKLKRVTAEVAEEISKLYNVNLEMVMVKRYIDTLSWDDIAKTLDLKMRTVLKFHGKALPRMRRILLTDGLVRPSPISSCR